MLKPRIKMLQALEELIEEHSAFGPIYRREVCAICPRTNRSCSSQHSSFINRSRKRGEWTDPGVFTNRFRRARRAAMTAPA
jgi:hypothetical protein